MTPKQARRILREMNRRDRRLTLRGIYKYQAQSDPPGRWFTLTRDGIPLPVPPVPSSF